MACAHHHRQHAPSWTALTVCARSLPGLVISSTQCAKSCKCNSHIDTEVVTDSDNESSKRPAATKWYKFRILSMAVGLEKQLDYFLIIQTVPDYNVKTYVCKLKH